MSKYIHIETLRSFLLNDVGWKKFKKDIQSNCHFQVLICGDWSVTDMRQISASCLLFRFYDKEGIRYYHVSNDNRRKIVSYLEDWAN